MASQTEVVFGMLKEDYRKAIFWYRKAAAKNDPKALYNIGLCYKHGDGVKRSNRWARHYFEKARILGHKNANKQLKALTT